jgi:hypothetical protein
VVSVKREFGWMGPRGCERTITVEDEGAAFGQGQTVVTVRLGEMVRDEIELVGLLYAVADVVAISTPCPGHG